MTRFLLRGIAAMALVALVAASTPVAEAAHIDVKFISQTNQSQISRGDFVRVRFEVCNNGASGMSQLGRVFVRFDVPGGGQVNHTIENKSVPVNTCLEYRFKDLIPMNAPAGMYTSTVGFEWNGGANIQAETRTFTLPSMLSAQAAPATAGALTVAPTEAGPNPFSTSTTIRYALAEEAEVDLAVYDLRGRQVAALVSGTQAAGAQAAVFQGDDLPSGVYMWRLSIDGAVQTGRVSLVR